MQTRAREEELEVQCNPHYFRQNISLILSQKEKRRKEVEREKKEKEAREQRQRELEREKEKEAMEHKGKLEVRATLLLLTGLSLQPRCRRKGGERNSNVRRKRRRQGNAMKNLCVVTPPFSMGHDSDSIAEGGEAKGA